MHLRQDCCGLFKSGLKRGGEVERWTVGQGARVRNKRHGRWTRLRSRWSYMVVVRHMGRGVTKVGAALVKRRGEVIIAA